MRNLFFCLFFISWTPGCQNGSSSGKGSSETKNSNQPAELLSLKQQIPGTWVATQLSIEVNSEMGSDRDIHLEAEMVDFQDILNLQAWSGTFREDGTFIDVVIGMGENDRREDNGQWSIVGDSLQMFYLTPKQRIQKYHVNIRGPVCIYTGYVDWDKDGKKDDKLTGRFDKVVRN